MKDKIAVYIATTDGPVRIERIKREQVPLSEVFLGRSIDPVEEISEGYDNFVQPGRPIDKAFGPFENVSFRMELSGEIKTGQSWQLAAFIAHGLESEGRLAEPDDIPAQVLFLSGKVNIDLKTEKVGHLQEKIHGLKEERQKWLDKSIDVLIYTPEEDLKGKSSIDSIPVEPLTNVTSILNKFDISYRSLLSKKPKASKSSVKKYVLTLLTLTIMGCIAYLANTLPSPSTEKPASNIPKQNNLIEVTPVSADSRGIEKPTIHIYERRAPVGVTCANIHFGSVDEIRVLVKKMKNGELLPSNLSEICGLFIEVNNISGKNGLGRVILSVESGKYVGQTTDKQGKTLDKHVEWLIDLPKNLSQPFSYRLIVEMESGQFEVAHTVNP